MVRKVKMRMVLIVKMEDEELTQCVSRRMRLGTGNKGYNPADDAKMYG